MTQLFPHIVLRDLTRPVKQRNHYPYSSCGPYYWCPMPSTMQRDGWSTYTDRSETMTGFRLRYTDANEYLSYGRLRWITGYWTDEHGTSDTIKPVVFQLPRGRGYLAGWTMGAGMIASIEAGIHDDPKDAAFAAHDAAERAAEHERDYQADMDREAREAEDQEDWT